MLIRKRLLCLLLSSWAIACSVRAESLDGATPEAASAEAARLYSNANDYVSNMTEGQYSYSYLQFYWKRAQSNLDRIERVYPDSPTARSLTNGELKIGPFEQAYFKERVLYNLELKRVAAFDDVNCAIFLYGRNEDRADARRDAALAEIIEVLARRQRWGEALRFPVLSSHRPLLVGTVYKVAAFYGVTSITKKLEHDETTDVKRAAGFDELMAKGLALQGKPRAELLQFIHDHPTDEVRAAALDGLVERELLIRRYQTLHLAYGQAIQTVHLVVQNLTLRDDVAALGHKIYDGSGLTEAAGLSVLFAGMGTAPGADGSLEAHSAYLQYLADAGRLDAVGTYITDSGVKGTTRDGCRLKEIELLAEAGETSEAEKARAAYAPAFSPGADDAGLAEILGRINATEPQLVVRDKTFADLPIADPCVMATAIMEWSLSPNRSQRGATPWDAVVTRYAGGFDHLPKGASAAVVDAASTLKPY